MHFGNLTSRSRRIFKWSLRIIPLMMWMAMAYLFINMDTLNQGGLHSRIFEVIFLVSLLMYIIIGSLVIPDLLASYFNDPRSRWKYIIMSALTAGLGPLVIYYIKVDRHL
jgi:hypothetical protein